MQEKKSVVPSAKTGAYTGIALAVSVLITWGLTSAGIVVPAEVSAAVATIVGYVAKVVQGE